MFYSKELVLGKLLQWERYIQAFSLPAWEEIPDIGLYMDQVILLLTQYLDYMPPDIKDKKGITASTINNYVRLKVMPEPVKKKYYRTHIAYMVMILVLKQTLSIAEIRGLLPGGLMPEEVQGLYTAFARRHEAVSDFFTAAVRQYSAPILAGGGPEEEATEQTVSLIMTAAIAGGFSRILAEKLLLLEGQLPAPEQETEGAELP